MLGISEDRRSSLGFRLRCWTLLLLPVSAQDNVLQAWAMSLAPGVSGLCTGVGSNYCWRKAHILHDFQGWRSTLSSEYICGVDSRLYCKFRYDPAPKQVLQLMPEQLEQRRT